MSDNLFESEDAGLLQKATSLERQQRAAARLWDFAHNVRAERGRRDAKASAVVVVAGKEERAPNEVTRVKPQRQLPQAQRLNNVSARAIKDRPFGRAEHDVHPMPLSRVPRADGRLDGWLEPRNFDGPAPKPTKQLRVFRRRG